MNRTLTALFLTASVVAAPAARAENWPHWRGPNYDGVSAETNLPTEWGEGKNLAWKLPLPGMGGSTPVVWGDRIFLTSEDGKDLVLMCVGTDGKELWKRRVGAATPKVRGTEGNGASATPSTDGKHVWCFFGSGDLACFDMEGKEVWHLNAQERYGKFKTYHGFHTTPLLYGDRLYVQLIHSNAALVLALDKATGKEVWKVVRKSDGHTENEHSYASPTVWRKGDKAYLITHGNDYAIGHRLEDGGEIWRVGDLNPKDRYNAFLRFVASPVATPDLIVIPTAKNHAVVGLKPEATGMVRAGSKFEKWRLPNGTPDVPSPLVHDGLAYLCRENGFLSCLDAKTGKQHYSERVHNFIHRASPVYADGKVYLTARDGTATVVKAGPTFEKLATNKLPDNISASPAVSGGRIYLRGYNALYAIGSK
ncbi:MAG TPA: PQQ-binding-like beta-propeller repeat protein [Gemmataceae bacterium]|nr:PQQ-binding-like beta-propeller repeat protein [Gemmataceae bacterium]